MWAQILPSNGINAQCGGCGNALYAAAGDHETVVRLLVTTGPDVNSQGAQYGNAFCAVSAEGHETGGAVVTRESCGYQRSGGGNDNALRDTSVGGFERWCCCYSKRVQISTFQDTVYVTRT